VHAADGRLGQEKQETVSYQSRVNYLEVRFVKCYDGNGVKPRFDGKGSEFGLMHRDIGPGYLMFDIDRLSANVQVDLELRRENEGWVEYRQNGKTIHFVALFEVKKQKTEHTKKALNNEESSTLARNEIARRLECRLFVVFATNGKAPFEFWELDALSEKYEVVGVLNYSAEERASAAQRFWRDVLKIQRYCFPGA
jgi:hypothetical protein